MITCGFVSINANNSNTNDKTPAARRHPGARPAVSGRPAPRLVSRPITFDPKQFTRFTKLY